MKLNICNYERFFNYYYADGGLSGNFIFSESCDFMGNESANDLDLTFANTLVDCSAESVIGFYNSVMANYSRELMLHYFEELLSGNTSIQTFNSAKEKYGYNDFDYRKPSFIEYLFDKDVYEKMGSTAIPLVIKL